MINNMLNKGSICLTQKNEIIHPMMKMNTKLL